MSLRKKAEMLMLERLGRRIAVLHLEGFGQHCTNTQQSNQLIKDRLTWRTPLKGLEICLSSLAFGSHLS
eukprot:3499979-Amphidinium_carterae.1